MAINLSRNTRLWVSTVDKDGVHDNSTTFEIPVQEGYSLSQSVATADVSVEEAGPTPTRGGKRFNSSLDPVEWSFNTYFNPYIHSDTNTYMVDMLLWHAVASSDAATPDFDNVSTSAEVYGAVNKFLVGFADNAAHELTKLYMYFKIDNDVYYVSGVQVGQADISIDISDIAQVAWTGNALSYERIPTPSFITGTGGVYDTTAPVNDYVAVPTNKKYLVNKLTTMEFQSDVSGSTLFYSIPITGGSIAINNNITYLTPNTLAEVDSPIGSFTGSFEVTGSLEAYMRDTGKTGSTALLAKGTTELLEDMLANPGQITNITNIVMNVGGETVGSPQVKIKMPSTHIAVPSLSVDDVVSTSIEFKAMPDPNTVAGANLQSGSEISLEISAAKV